MPAAIQKEIFTLADFLRLESLGDARLLCDGTGAQKVERATVVEDANLSLWAEKGDVLLSSGYPFWRDPGVLAAMLPGLREQGVVALGLKPERVASAVPDVVVAAARQAGLPLIQLPATAVFSTIVYECRDELLRRREAEFLQTQAHAQKLLERLLTATSAEKSLSIVEEAIGGNPAIALSSDNELILSPATRTLLSGGAQDDLIRQLDQTPAGELFILRIHDAPRQVRARHYTFSGRKGCSILVLECNRQLQEAELEILRRVNPVLALEINSTIAIKKLRRKYKDRFVKNLIAGTLGSESDICTVAEAQGYQVYPGLLYRVAIVNPQKGGAISEKTLGSVSHLVQSFEFMVAFTLLDGRLLLVFEDHGEPLGALGLSAFLQRLRNILRKDDISLSVSDPAALTEIPGAYLEARRISELGAHCATSGAVITYDQLGVLALLALLPGNTAVQRSQKRLLAPLKEYDAAHKTCLLHTLEVYLSTCCNAKRTAEKLFTHYNTVNYRIERIQQICGVQLDDAEQILQLQVALKMDLIHPEAS